jgi:hypothetical protein
VSHFQERSYLRLLHDPVGSYIQCSKIKVTRWQKDALIRFICDTVELHEEAGQERLSLNKNHMEEFITDA